MSTWTAVSRAAHADKHWRPRKGFEFAIANQLVPFVLAEITKLLPHYALGFIKTAENSFQPVVVLGIGGERNLYVNPDSQWLCSYVPTELQAYPFSLLADQNGKRVLCIADSALSSDSSLPALFTTEGELAQLAAERFNFLAQCEQSRLVTVNATAALTDAQLIEPWPVAINREGGEPISINGLYRVSEQALNKLDGEKFAALRQSGALALAYGQIFSTTQLSQLAQRAEHLGNLNQLKSSTQGIDQLFSSADSGSLNFDAFDLDAFSKT